LKKVMKLGAAAFMFIVIVGTGNTQTPPDGEVQSAEGFAEILLPDVGWRQAVLGRRVPSGSTLTTWSDAELSIALLDNSVSMGSFSLLRVVQLGDTTRLVAPAGIVTVNAGESGVELDYRGTQVLARSAEFELVHGALEVILGTVVLRDARGRERSLIAGESLRLLREAAAPIFP
jgi:hypothetical protein